MAEWRGIEEEPRLYSVDKIIIRSNKKVPNCINTNNFFHLLFSSTLIYNADI
jgi:hypothetical protein